MNHIWPGIYAMTLLPYLLRDLLDDDEEKSATLIIHAFGGSIRKLYCLDCDYLDSLDRYIHCPRPPAEIEDEMNWTEQIPLTFPSGSPPLYSRWAERDNKSASITPRRRFVHLVSAVRNANEYHLLPSAPRPRDPWRRGDAYATPSI